MSTNEGKAEPGPTETKPRWNDQTTTPGVNDRMLQFFRYEHLPENLRAVSAPFGRLAQQIVENLPSNPERTVALRKLLEAKDCAVRCVLFEG